MATVGGFTCSYRQRWESRGSFGSCARATKGRTLLAKFLKFAGILALVGGRIAHWRRRGSWPADCARSRKLAAILLRLAIRRRLSVLHLERPLAGEAFSRLASQDLCGFYEGLAYARLAAAQGDGSDTGLVIQLLALAADLLDPAASDARADLGGQVLAYAQATAGHAKGAAGERFHALYEDAMDTADAETMAAASYYVDLLRRSEKQGAQ